MTEPPQQPSTGRVVHLVTEVPDPNAVFDPETGETPEPTQPPAKVCTAAIVTGVHADGDTVSLHAFAAPPWTATAAPSSPVSEATHEELADQIEPGPVGHTVGTWHWPERV